MTLFSYHPGTSLVHALDVRCKCALVCLLSLAVLQAGIAENLCCLCFVIIVLKVLGTGLIRLIIQLRIFFLFLVLIFLSRWAATPGDPMACLYGVCFTAQGMNAGLLIVLRFLTVMLLGLVLVLTTRTMEIKAAVQWFLKPVPFIPEKRVAVMMGLALKFIPLILGQARDVTHAVNARCGNLRKNPVRRLLHLTWPLLKKTFKTADDLSLAMQARCYSDNRTDPEFRPIGKKDLVMTLVLVFAAIIILVAS